MRGVTKPCAASIGQGIWLFRQERGILTLKQKIICNDGCRRTREDTNMTKHDEARRAFLVGAGAVAGAGLVPEALAQNAEQNKGASAQAPAHSHANGAEHGAFFNDADALTIAALTEQLMPGAPGKPGAGDAGVLNYIDLALAGAYADLQDFYRRGLAALDAYCRNTHNVSFVKLTDARKDDVLTALDEGKATGFTWPTAQAFFNVLRTHTMEGMFADPIYGGNKDFAGWRLVRFPGAQPLFTPGDMQSKQAFTREPIVGLQAQTQVRGG
jgi:gluconate 2-dehydrogenase gamma chain